MLKKPSPTINRRNNLPASGKTKLLAWLAEPGRWPGYPYLLLFAGWLQVLIALPLVILVWGQAATAPTVSVNVLVQSLLVLTILRQAWGARRTAITAAMVVGLTWAIEFVGSTTGLPFGRYSYTEVLQPQLGHVPLLIPLAWLMMLPPAWAAAYLANGRRTGWRFVLFSALALTAWDLFIDPQMVRWGFWVWAEPGLYFGIPLLNFAGWALSGALITALARPANLPVAPLMFVFVVTWLLQTLGQLIFWQLPGPALCGFVGMGLFVWLAYRKGKQ